MRQSTFVKLGLLAFLVILLTFLVRGTSRLFLGDRIATALSAPFGIAAILLVAILLTVAILNATGLKSLEQDLDE